MATETQRNRLRIDLAVTSAGMNDAVVDDFFARAAEDYSDNPAAQEAQARLYALGALEAEAAKEVDYTQNQTTEKASQRFSQLGKLRSLWEDKLNKAIAASVSAVQWGRMKTKPKRGKEYPNG